MTTRYKKLITEILSVIEEQQDEILNLTFELDKHIAGEDSDAEFVLDAKNDLLKSGDNIKIVIDE